MGLESKIETAVCAYALAKGVRAFKFVSPGCPGVPDRMFVGTNGRIAFIEFKAPGAKPAPHQSRILADLRARGIFAGAVSSIAHGMEIVDTLVS